MLNAANNIQADLTRMLFDGQKAIVDQAMKQVGVNLEMQAALQQQQTALSAVAMMTGLGTKVDTVV